MATYCIFTQAVGRVGRGLWSAIVEAAIASPTNSGENGRPTLSRGGCAGLARRSVMGEATAPRNCGAVISHASAVAIARRQSQAIAWVRSPPVFAAASAVTGGAAAGSG